MDDPGLVGRLQRFGDLTRDDQRFLQRNGTAGDPVRKRLPFDELEDERANARAFLNAINGRYVLMLQRGEHSRFPLETGDPLVGHAYPVTINGTTYHPQTQALLPWFERQSPSSAYAGTYSYPDTTALTTVPETCTF